MRNRFTKTIIAATLISVATPAFAEWRVAESENFQIYSEEKPEEMVKLAARLERFKMLLTAFSGLKKPRPGMKLKIFWVSEAWRVQNIIKGGYGFVQGYYVAATPYGPIAVVPGKTRSTGRRVVGSAEQEGIDPEVVLQHEYGHHFMLQNFPVAFPPWFVEGFAEYYGHTEFDDNGDIRLGMYADARKAEFRYLGVMALPKLFNNKAKPPASSFYGTSWLLTHYVNFNNDRRPEFRAYLSDVQNGMDSVEAANKNFKGGLKELEKELKKYLNGNNFPYQTLGNVPDIDRSKVTLSTLPADRAAAIIPEIRYLSGFSGDKDERGKLIETIRDLSSKNPQSAYLKAFLANLHLDNDEDDLAVSIANEALGIEATNQRARLVKASALMEKAQTLEGGNTKNPEPPKPSKEKEDSDDSAYENEIVVTASRTKESQALWAEALKLIVAANRSDSEDPLPLYLYYEYLKRRGETISETATDGLAKAHVVIPQYQPLRLRLAEEYSDQGENAAATAVIKPAAFSPHGGAQRRTAQALLKRYECLAATPGEPCEFKPMTAEEEKKAAEED